MRLTGPQANAYFPRFPGSETETMPDQLPNKLIDKRVVHRYIEKGLVGEKDFEQHLRKLPDLADQAAAVESEIEEEGQEA